MQSDAGTIKQCCACFRRIWQDNDTTPHVGNKSSIARAFEAHLVTEWVMITTVKTLTDAPISFTDGWVDWSIMQAHHYMPGKLHDLHILICTEYFVGDHTWVRAVLNKAHRGVGSVQQREGCALNGVWQHTSEPCAT